MFGNRMLHCYICPNIFWVHIIIQSYPQCPKDSHVFFFSLLRIVFLKNYCDPCFRACVTITIIYKGHKMLYSMIELPQHYVLYMYLWYAYMNVNRMRNQRELINWEKPSYIQCQCTEKRATSQLSSALLSLWAVTKGSFLYFYCFIYEAFLFELFVLHYPVLMSMPLITYLA